MLGCSPRATRSASSSSARAGSPACCSDIAPDTALDLTAANALYRPGPMKGGVTWEFAKRKHNIFLRQLLERRGQARSWPRRYGLIAYQEQVMEIAQRLGGSLAPRPTTCARRWASSTASRAAAAAKDFMGRSRRSGSSGCSERGIKREVADEIWHKMLEFGHYGFNRSHTACYSLQAYQDAYLKAKYPAAFYAALLTYEDEDDRIEVGAARGQAAQGIEIVFPDVNESDGGLHDRWRGGSSWAWKASRASAPTRPRSSVRAPSSRLTICSPATGRQDPFRPLIEAGAAGQFVLTASTCSHGSLKPLPIVS